MKYVIDNESLKTFSKLILTCIKLGEEIFFECTLNELIIKTVNDERTLFFFAKFKFNFFTEFQNVDVLEFKFKSKSCFLPFKTSLFLEKNVNSCLFSFESDIVSVVLNCDNDVQFFYELPVILTNLIIEVDNESQFQNYIILKIRHFLNVFNNFPNSTEYCILRANKEKIFFESFDFDQLGIKTNFCLNSSEFFEYQVKEEITITFSLKPLKTFLNSYADKQANCLMYLEGNYLPIHIVIKHQNIETKLIVASLDIEPESKVPETTNISTLKESNYNSQSELISSDCKNDDNISNCLTSKSLSISTDKLNDLNDSNDLNDLNDENNLDQVKIYKSNEENIEKDENDYNIVNNSQINDFIITFNSNNKEIHNSEEKINTQESIKNNDYIMDDTIDFEIEDVSKTPECSSFSSSILNTQISQMNSNENSKMTLKQQYCNLLQKIPVLLGTNLTDKEEEEHFRKFLVEYKHCLP